jgi:predicted DsbA family dithiol-disulfide isomerase
MKVEIWSDVVCPWCYLGKRRFETALASFPHSEQVDVVYRSFELDPSATSAVTTPTIELLATKYGMSVQQAEDAQRHMEQRAAQDGLTFHMDGLRSGNTRDAHRLLHLAEARNRQPQLIERLYRAYFTDRASVFDHASLTNLAFEVGLDQDEATAVLTSDAYGDAVAADEAMARSLGATGVPFFVIDRRYGISGAQPAEAIGQVLERAWAETEAQAS